MCGICGVITEQNHKKKIYLMTKELIHRGPDNIDYFFEKLRVIQKKFKKKLLTKSIFRKLIDMYKYTN